MFRKPSFLPRCLWALLWVLPLAISDVQAQTAYRFSGTTSSYATVTKRGTSVINNFSSPHDFTIEIRFKLHSTPSGSAKVVSMHSSPANGFFMEFVSGTTALKAGMGYNGNYITQTSSSLVLGTWYTAALVYNRTSNAFNYYINGSLVGTTTPLPGSYYPETTYALAIAKSMRWGDPSPIDVDFFRIWTNQQTQSLLNANQSSEVSCSSTNLLLQYRFDDPSGSATLTDCTSNLNNGTLFDTGAYTNCEVTNNQSRTIRQGTSLLVHNRSYNVSGIYRDTIFRAGLCDSIIVTNLTVMTCNVTVSIGTNGNTLTANALGGQGGYTFLWNNQATTATLNNAVAGTTYQVTVTDVLGCTATATLVFAAPTPTASNNDLTFDGINDYVNLGNITELNNASAFTFEAMIYSTSTSDNRNLFSKRVSNSDNIQIQYNDGRFIISIGGGALGTAYGGIGAAGLPLHTWFHLAVVYDGTGATNSDKVKLYVNAIPRTLSFTGTVQSVTTSNTAACYLGAETNYPTALTAFQGKMNDVRIWNTARTAAQLMASNNVCLTNSTGLIAHYKLDETSGNTAASTTGNYNGTLHNFVGNPWNASTSGCAAATPIPTQSLYQLQVTGADCRNTQPATLQINMNATRSCIDALTLRVRFDTTQIFFDHPMTIQKGAAIPASGVVLYHLRRDTLIISVDLDAGCIQGTSGTNVLSIPFRLRPSFAVSNASSLFRLTVSEERITTITTQDSTSQTFQVSPILIGNVSVVRPNGSAVQGTTLPVTLLVGDSCNRLTRTIVADTNSKTIVRLDSFHFVRFQRPALPVVASPLIGGYDVFLVRAYLHGDTVLTARQKIAADVNNDGAITALDVTILRRRALGIYTNFADYSGGRLTSDYQFTVSPNLDRPSVCIGLPPLSTICDTPSVQVTMITLGDLNGDTDTNPSGRIERETEPIAKQNSKVTFNLHHATRVADEWKIPVYANQVTRGLDLQLLNLSLNPNVFRVAAAHSNFEVLGNGNGSNYYIVGNANILQGIPANDTLFYLYMKTNPKACQQLGQLNGYLDAQRILTDCLTAVTGTAELEPNSVEMYPNPTEGNVQMTIQQPLSNPTTLRIYDMLGRCVRTQVLQSGNRHFTIDISDLAQGIYQFQFENQAKKLVKQ